MFKEFENPTKKSDVFRRSLPDDTQLHRFARQIDLLGSLADIGNQPVNIPIDLVVDTESNLRPIVMRKILYRLGLPHDSLDTFEGTMNELLNKRNSVAHGSAKAGIEDPDYALLETSVYSVMGALVRMIIDALKTGTYLKPSSTPIKS